MRIHRVIERTRAEGPGQRFVLWVQGCKSACPGCYARELWSLDGGKEASARELIARMDAVRGEIEGITLLGGEPFLQAGELSLVAAAARERGLSVMVFTGFLYEELLAEAEPGRLALLENTDLLIDGPYEAAQRDFSRPWAGSKNQRFLFLTKRYSMEDVMACKNCVELRVGGDGVLRVNGMADFDALQGMFHTTLSKGV